MRFLSLFRKTLVLTVLLLPFTACFKNDMPYPYVHGTIDAMEVEGAVGCEIDPVRNTVTLEMDEVQDLSKVRIRSVRFGEEQTWAETAIEGVHDLREPLYVVLGTYGDQRYRWKIEAKQSIERVFSVSSQIGHTFFDEENRRILLTVSKSVSLTYLVVDQVKLGPREITSYSVDLTTVHNFSEPVKVNVRYHDVDQEWVIHVGVSDKNVMVNHVSPRTRCAWVDASGLAGQANGVKYRKKGEEEWTDVPDASGAGSFAVRLPDLEAETEYEYFVYSGEEETDVDGFVTQDAPQLPNPGFEAITPAGSYFEWYDAGAAAPEDRQAWWGSGNGSAVMGIPGSADMGYVISVPDAEDKAEGSRSARLESKWAVVKFAAGNIFSGYFGGLVGTKGGKVNYGRPFTHRPDTLVCKLKYVNGPINRIDTWPKDHPIQLGDPDIAQVYVALGTWDHKKYGGTKDCPVQVNTTDMTTKFNPRSEAVIAYGECTFDKPTADIAPGEMEQVTTPVLDAGGAVLPGWVEVRIPLVYSDDFTVPTHIIVSFASSYFGDYFSGYDQSRLWVDDVRLIY